MRFWLAISRLTWPLYRMGWRKPYGIATGKYAVHFMKDQEPLGADFEAVWDENADKLYEK